MMIEQTAAEWRAEAAERFGKNLFEARFVCPRCGTVTSVRELVAAYAPGQPSAGSAATNCIGRVDPERGCDWAAYGLLGTMGKGRVILMEDGTKIEVFDFAPAEESPMTEDEENRAAEKESPRD